MQPCAWIARLNKRRMQKANSLGGKWWNAVFFLTAALVIVADQLSKLWIRSNLLVGQSLFEAGFFQITHIHNTGAAFGLFRGYSFVLTVVASVSIAVLLFYVLFICRRFPRLDSKLSRVTLSLILGGSIGNLIDRIRFGYVIDFIGIGIWPTFNLADSSVTVGAIVFAYSLFRLLRVEKHWDGQGI